jgi:hypothetical protein
MVEINVTKLAGIGAEGKPFAHGEEFHYAGIEYQIPSKYLK